MRHRTLFVLHYPLSGCSQSSYFSFCSLHIFIYNIFSIRWYILQGPLHGFLKFHCPLSSGSQIVCTSFLLVLRVSFIWEGSLTSQALSSPGVFRMLLKPQFQATKIISFQVEKYLGPPGSIPLLMQQSRKTTGFDSRPWIQVPASPNLISPSYSIIIWKLGYW